MLRLERVLILRWTGEELVLLRRNVSVEMKVLVSGRGLMETTAIDQTIVMLHKK